MALRDERAVQRALKRFADVRRDLEAEVLPSIVVGRNEDGSAQLLGLHGECAARGGAGGYQGEIVTRLPSLTGRQGTTGAALLSNRGSLGTVWLEAVDPYPLPRGASGLTVTLTGGGFTANTLFDFLAEGSEDDLNPDVTVTGRTFLDSETVELTVSVAADADLFPWATVTYGDPAVAGSIGSAAGAGKTQLRLRKERAYGVGLSGENYIAFLYTDTGCAAVTYQNGSPLATLAETEELTLQLTDRPVFHASRYLILSTDAAIEVWDVVANTVSTAAPTGGHRIVGAAGEGSTIWWCEFPETDWIAGGPGWQSTVLLRSAGLDLGSPATIETVTVEDSFHWEWAASPDWFALTATSAMAERRANDAVNHEVLTYFRTRLQLDGLGSEFFDIGSGAGLLVGQPEPSGGAYALLVSGGSSVRAVPDDVDGAVVTVNPGGSWSADVLSLSMTSDRAEVLLFGVDGGGGGVAARYSAADFEGSPIASFAVSDHPEWMLPTLFFIYEPN